MKIHIVNSALSLAVTAIICALISASFIAGRAPPSPTSILHQSACDRICDACIDRRLQSIIGTQTSASTSSSEPIPIAPVRADLTPLVFTPLTFGLQGAPFTSLPYLDEDDMHISSRRLLSSHTPPTSRRLPSGHTHLTSRRPPSGHTHLTSRRLLSGHTHSSSRKLLPCRTHISSQSLQSGHARPFPSSPQCPSDLHLPPRWFIGRESERVLENASVYPSLTSVGLAYCPYCSDSRTVHASPLGAYQLYMTAYECGTYVCFPEGSHATFSGFTFRLLPVECFNIVREFLVHDRSPWGTLELRVYCKGIAASLYRAFMRRWDYKALRAGGTHSACIPDMVLVDESGAYLLLLPFHCSLCTIVGGPLYLFAQTADETKSHDRTDDWPLLTRRQLERTARCVIGGGPSNRIGWSTLKKYVADADAFDYSNNTEFTFVDRDQEDKMLDKAKKDNLVPSYMPFSNTVWYMPLTKLKSACKVHGLNWSRQWDIGEGRLTLSAHECSPDCPTIPYVTLFKKVLTKTERNKKDYSKRRKKEPHVSVQAENETVSFPPEPLEDSLVEDIVRGFCADTSKPALEEIGCACCGSLCNRAESKPLADRKVDLSLLTEPHATRIERLKSDDPIRRMDGPVLASGCDRLCRFCYDSLLDGRRPRFALANGLWVGEVPDVLKGLSYAEMQLISKIRHNRAVVRVRSGRGKMIANAVMFASPIPKVYEVLPPPKEEINEVIAFTFLGTARPTEDDLRRTPMLVRLSVVEAALRWLKLNHPSYREIRISQENLATYREENALVYEFRRLADEDTIQEATATSMANEDVDAPDAGPCPFVVHGLTAEKFSKMTIDQLKSAALEHLQAGRSVLGVGHDDKPEGIFDNPKAYPAMFPWLFPYGLGGIGMHLEGSKSMSSMVHKRHLLMYHDKRFQTDLYFPMIAFNHEQIKASSTASNILVKRADFPRIINKLTVLNLTVLGDLSRRLEEGEPAKAETEEEKTCYEVIQSLDYIGGHVQGSVTTKKYMRNEIWSLVNFMGSPSWFVTLSPSDSNHPIALYFADHDLEFKPNIRSWSERSALVARNPVAASRFFNIMVKVFIKHVLGVGLSRRGLFGPTSAYYAAVEQQGRLTLHLHSMIWVRGAPSPQVIRDRLMDGDSAFEREMIRYLEEMHTGQLLTGDMESVKLRLPLYSTGISDSDVHRVHAEDGDGQRVSDETESDRPRVKEDPTQTMPLPPPSACRCRNHSCACEEQRLTWWSAFKGTVDALILRVQVHKCIRKKAARTATHLANGTRDPMEGIKGCKGDDDVCDARFPRDFVGESFVDRATGTIHLVKREVMMNCVTPVLTYLTRGNTDTTSLQSGTSMKAVILYVSDYITKCSLKTYHIMSCIKSVFERNPPHFEGSAKDGKRARKLMLQMVNALAPRMEIGSPMAASYLLGMPDHYKSHDFVVFWWKSYVNRVLDDWPSSVGKSEFEERLVLKREQGQLVGTSVVDDYVHRPARYENYCLFEWIQCAKKSKRTPKQLKEFLDPDSDDSDGEVESNDAGHSTVDVLSELDRFPRVVPLKDGSQSSPLKINRSPAYEPFLSSHPQYASFHVHCDPSKREYVVPNFAGGAIPRNDQGDREYYCATMLTLFVPWRRGRDLKEEGYNWDTAFRGHTFGARHLQLMENCNLRYECADARDDYRAELKKKKRKVAAQNDDVGDPSDEDDFQYAGDYGEDLDIEVPDEDTGPGWNRTYQTVEMARTYADASGWSERLPGGPTRTVPEAKEPGRQLRGSEWASYVRKLKDTLFHGRLKSIPAKKLSASGNSADPVCGLTEKGVKLLPASYFTNEYTDDKPDLKALIDDIVLTFSLNPDQTRAFSLIAQHAGRPQTEPLRMFLGGMGGTGKSTVIRALIEFFKRRGEEHRFIILAPTGTAAALLNGFTYHSVLGMGWGANVDGATKSEGSDMRNINERLLGVEYIFIDEVSMLNCSDMYRISARLAKARGRHDLPFGGMNMIFAGDFAQLPPVQGPRLYDRSVQTDVERKRMSVKVQMNIIGKAMWHQVTTVVILSENMRMRSATEEDRAMALALANMRYAACTPRDISFLLTRVVGSSPRAPKLNEPRFRNVSIITARNAEKDAFNDIGARRFAADTGQDLVSFYSCDSRAPEDKPSPSRRGRKPKRKLTAASGLSDSLRRVLWASLPCFTGHIAGRLDLCRGMPVMIRSNIATELCMTKGQEAVVYDWTASTGPYKQRILDVLFVKLISPPKTVQIHGLEENVVPITPQSTRVKCQLKNDNIVEIDRSQVPVLLNFAMTDYSSQGKTRPDNVVNLTNSRSHQAYYTALSRSSSALGTAIVSSFNDLMITKGLDDQLKREFRNLEVLNEITRLRYEMVLPDAVTGDTRHQLIRSFLDIQGDDFDIPGLHSALKWKSESDWDDIDTPVGRQAWQYAEADRADEPAPATTSSNSKRKRSRSASSDDIGDDDRPAPKVARALDEPRAQVATRPAPRGYEWDANDWSCPYDAVFTILHSAWSAKPSEWSTYLARSSTFAKDLVRFWTAHRIGDLAWADTRDKLRTALHMHDPTSFPYGPRPASADRLVCAILGQKRIASKTMRCDRCHAIRAEGLPVLSQCDTLYARNLLAGRTHALFSTADWLDSVLKGKGRASRCLACGGVLSPEVTIHYTPRLLCLDRSREPLLISPSVSFNGLPMKLSGIVYGGQNHFTCRVVDETDSVYRHDGMINGLVCEKEADLSRVTPADLGAWYASNGRRKDAILVFYRLATGES